MKDILNMLCSHKTNKLIVKIYFIFTVIQLLGECIFYNIVGALCNWVSKNLPFLMSTSHKEQAPNFLISYPLVLPAVISFFIAGIAEFIYENNYSVRTVSYTILTVVADMILATPYLFILYILGSVLI